MTSSEEMGSVRRRPAKSGKVSYGDPVVLHDSSKSRIVFMPFFIPHSSHTELTGKIITYRKHPPPLDWAVAEEKSVSLSEAATRRLLGALKTHLAVTQDLISNKAPHVLDVAPSSP